MAQPNGRGASPIGQITSPLRRGRKPAVWISEIPADQPVFVICAVGGRSRQVVDHLRSRGVQAINVAGGTSGWAQRGWPLDR